MINTSNKYKKLEKSYVVGIIGSEDKIVTAYILEEILRNAGYKTGLISKRNILINGKSDTLGEDNEEYEISSMVKKMVDKNINVTIVEIPSDKIKALYEENFKIDILIHTNTTLDRYKDNKYLEDKIKLIGSLRNNNIVIVNIDDGNSMKLIEKNKDIMVISYGLNGKSSITASSMSLEKFSKFNLCLQRGITTIHGNNIDPLEYPIYSNLIGRDSMYNTLAAIGACLYFDISLEIISNTLSNIDGIHRMLKKIYDKEFTIIDCFADCPSNYESALHTMQNLDYNKLIIVNSIPENTNSETTKEIADIISGWKDALNLESVAFFSKKDNINTLNHYSEIFESNNIKYEVYTSLEDSIKEGLNKVEVDDLLLLLGGKNMENGKEIIRLANLI